MKFSVIIPVYNCDKYIERCIETVLQQTFTDFQMILIDDGSEDRSYQICRKFAEQDDRIVLVGQKNQGPSMARNKGLELASGEYIVFIDSDDYVERDYLELLNKQIEKYNSDIVFVGFKFEEQESGKCLAVVDLPEASYERSMFHYAIRNLIERDMFGYSWCKVAKTSLFREHVLEFDRSYSLHEDLMFACDLCDKATNISILNASPYHYIKGQDSLCTKYRPDIMENMEYVNNKVFEFYKKIFIDDIDQMIIKRAVFSIFLVFKNSLAEISENIDIKQYKEFLQGNTIKEIYNRSDYYSEAIQGKKKWIVYAVIKTRNPYLFKALVSIYKKAYCNIT